MPDTPTPSLARDLAVAKLSEAFANDLITLDDLERRLASAYAAGSEGELATLTRDLPSPPEAALAPAQRAAQMARRQRLSAVFGNVERSGPVDVPPVLELRVFAGNIELDLSQARFGPGVTEIIVRAFMGNVEIVLPPGIAIENYAESFLSSVENDGGHHEPAPGASRVRLTGRIVMSSVEVGP